VQSATFPLFIGSSPNWMKPVGDDLNAKLSTDDGTLTLETAQVNIQQDAKKAAWTGLAEFKAMAADPQSPGTRHPQDLMSYIHPDAKAVLAFDIVMQQAPMGSVKIRIDCGYPCRGELDGTTVLGALALNTKTTVKIPLSCFANAGADFGMIDTPFLVQTDKPFAASFARVRWLVNATGDVDTHACEDFEPPPPPLIDPLPGPSVTLLGPTGFFGDLAPDSWSTNGTHVTANVASGVADLKFAADGGNGTFTFKGSAINLSNYAAGTMQFEVAVSSYGTNTQGLAIKMESPGDGCRNVDYILPDAVKPPADGLFHTITLNVADVAGTKNAPCFTLDNIVIPFGIFPVWDDQQGVDFQVRNVVLKMP
jgi:beta-glucosidase